MSLPAVGEFGLAAIDGLMFSAAASASRAAVVAMFAVAFGVLATPAYRQLLKSHRRLAVIIGALMLLPFFTPAILVGYAYLPVALRHIREPLAIELLYDLLLICRLAPVAALLWLLKPAPLESAMAAHCRILLNDDPARRARFVERCRAARFGKWGQAALGLGVIWLLAVQDFELASLLTLQKLPLWSQDVFESQASGAVLATSFRQAVIPLLLQLFVLGLLVMLLPGVAGRSVRHEADDAAKPISRLRIAAAAGCSSAIFLVAAGYPWASTAVEAASAFTSLFQRFTFQRQLQATVTFAGCASLIAVGLAAWLNRRTAARGKSARRWWLILCLPGLLGSLMLGLIVLTFRRGLSLNGYINEAPLMLALTWWLLPAACLAMAILSKPAHLESIHAARLLGAGRDATQHRHASRTAWEIRYRPAFWLWTLLLVAAAYEMTLASLLAPPTMPTAMVHLFNMMHYGHSGVLSAMTMITAAAPWLCALLVGLILRFAMPWRRYV